MSPPIPRGRKSLAPPDQLAGSAVSTRTFDCAALVLTNGRRGRARKELRSFHGHEAGPGSPAVTAGTRFDWASLTKPCVATLALVLDRDRRLLLETPVASLASGGSRSRVPEGVRLEDLLRHRSGIAPWWPLQTLRSRTPNAVLRFLLEEAPWEAPGRAVYSDLGFIAWGLLAERATGAALADLLRQEVFEPLGMTCAYGSPAPEAARSRLDNTVERRLAVNLLQVPSLSVRRAPRRGQPQDGNARALQRPAGHAGLFGTIDDLVRLGEEWLRPGRVLYPAQVAYALSGTTSHSLGWMRRRVRGSAGPALSAGAFGHTGFTGGSLWIDPELPAVFAVLAHRAGFEDLNPWRRTLHRAGVRWLERT